VAIILMIYFIEIWFNRRYKSKDSATWKTRKIALEEFVSLITEACYFIRFKPLREDLVFIFNALDTDRDGYITFQQYAEFIKKYLGNNIDIWAKPAPPAISPGGISDEEYAFVNAIWDELRVYFDRYDKSSKGYLVDAELRSFVIEVLGEKTEK
jgi:Ca2+-binding EF-hand superfamily protein